MEAIVKIRTMKLAFSSNAFKRYSIIDAIDIIARTGYAGIELMCDIPHAFPPMLSDAQIDSINNNLYKNRLDVSNLNAFTLYARGDVYHPSWIEDSPDLVETRIQHTIDCLNLAPRVGARNISTEPGGPIPSDRLTFEQYERLFLNGLSRVAGIAQDKKVYLLIEPEPGLLIENSSQFKNLLKKLSSSDYVKLNFDIGHFYCVNEDPSRLIYELADYIVHFHLADIASTRVHNHLLPGYGSIDFKSVFKSIKDIGFDGFVTVELYPYQNNPSLAAKCAFEYLDSLIQ